MTILRIFVIKSAFPKYCLCSLLKPIFNEDIIQSPKLSFKKNKTFVFSCTTKRKVAVTMDFKILEISK